MADFDAAVIGAGAVGLACAAKLSQRGQSVLVLEAAAHPGEGISARNSEVIHAGLYYPTGSLKHRMCVSGRRQLYGFLEARGIACAKCGKVVVATSEAEQEKIEALLVQGQTNGVEGLRLLSASEVAGLEPEVQATAGLSSPETGIFDSHQYMFALIAIIEGAGGHVALRTPLAGATPGRGAFTLATGGAEPMQLSATRLVNSAGLSAPDVARKIEGVAMEWVPEHRFAKGNYFRLSGRAPFRRLVYPAPVDGGLGVHATIDLAGNLRFGPDVEWIPEGIRPEDLDYAVAPARGDSFYAAIRRYWPGLPEGALSPDYSGIRPKLTGPGGTADFRIDGPEVHGLPGLVNLFGIESPGLTSSLAIGDEVARILH
ncbi:L-2-hydroxyglutarate oxidase LhgO [Aliiruegeria haliotis]|uniref:L-2-hydroxyglutarate oxidase LhgO n=1 Tax=Aliiruegeria haliotis TaxID=1280846 RepID=A0A2T0RTP0_9RHOB|nr:NAD(P)/FAD-dependent oxidoreductase [Aliiruegeria haliotis]PRY24443.1 L-2-hydroxyglutarate oxidase LhgO [Aliiruegeria haliotis]